jgi:hypothetical protein
MSGERESFTHIGIHIGADWLVQCHTYADTTPILAIGAGPVSLNITFKGKEADQSAVDFAHALVRDVHTFAAEVERSYAEHATADTTDIPDLAALLGDWSRCGRS